MSQLIQDINRIIILRKKNFKECRIYLDNVNYIIIFYFLFFVTYIYWTKNATYIDTYKLYRHVHKCLKIFTKVQIYIFIKD